MRRCKHPHWDDVERKFQPSRVAHIKMSMADPQTFQRMAFGLTTVTQRCVECGKLSSYTVTGDAS